MNVSEKDERTVHEIVQGVKENGELKKTFKVGEAFLYAEAKHYVLKVKSISSNLLYLRKDPNSTFNYSVYATCRRNNRVEPIYGDRIGRAKLPEDMKSHLEIVLPFRRKSLFMSLYPYTDG